MGSRRRGCSAVVTRLPLQAGSSNGGIAALGTVTADGRALILLLGLR